MPRNPGAASVSNNDIAGQSIRARSEVQYARPSRRTAYRHALRRILDCEATQKIGTTLARWSRGHRPSAGGCPSSSSICVSWTRASNTYRRTIPMSRQRGGASVSNRPRTTNAARGSGIRAVLRTAGAIRARNVTIATSATSTTGEATANPRGVQTRPERPLGPVSLRFPRCCRASPTADSPPRKFFEFL